MLLTKFAAQVKHLACDRKECGNRALCHMPITLARRQLARVAAEFAVLEPDRWLCIPFVLQRDDDDLFTPATVPDLQRVKTLTPFGTLAALEHEGAACGAVDVQYTTSRGEVYVLYLYWSAGTTTAVVTRYTILAARVITAQMFDRSRALESSVQVWRSYAQVPQAHADQVSQVLHRRV